MKYSRKLKFLKLNDNHLKDITPLIKIIDVDIYNNGKKYVEEEIYFDERYNFPNLLSITLKNNLRSREDAQNKNILQLFKNNNIDVDI